MKIILIILMIVLAVMELWMYFRLRRRKLRLDQRIEYVDAREESAREAMRRNGDTAVALRREARRIRNMFACTVFAEYTVTRKDLEAYAVEKIPAVVKSRIANKLGHAILAKYEEARRVGGDPELLERKSSEDGLDTYSVMIDFRRHEP